MKNERARVFGRQITTMSRYVAMFVRARRHVLVPVLRPAALVH